MNLLKISEFRQKQIDLDLDLQKNMENFYLKSAGRKRMSLQHLVQSKVVWVLHVLGFQSRAREFKIRTPSRKAVVKKYTRLFYQAVAATAIKIV